MSSSWYLNLTLWPSTDLNYVKWQLWHIFLSGNRRNQLSKIKRSTYRWPYYLHLQSKIMTLGTSFLFASHSLWRTILWFKLGMLHNLTQSFKQRDVGNKLITVRSTVSSLPTDMSKVLFLQCISKLHAYNSFPPRHLVVFLIWTKRLGQRATWEIY